LAEQGKIEGFAPRFYRFVNAVRLGAVAHRIDIVASHQHQRVSAGQVGWFIDGQSVRLGSCTSQLLGNFRIQARIRATSVDGHP
jgi:hypothetical protein